MDEYTINVARIGGIKWWGPDNKGSVHETSVFYVFGKIQGDLGNKNDSKVSENIDK